MNIGRKGEIEWHVWKGEKSRMQGAMVSPKDVRPPLNHGRHRAVLRSYSSVGGSHVQSIWHNTRCLAANVIGSQVLVVQIGTTSAIARHEPHESLPCNQRETPESHGNGGIMPVCTHMCLVRSCAPSKPLTAATLGG